MFYLELRPAIVPAMVGSMSEDQQYVTGTIIQPQKYNIVLTRDDEAIDFDFPPATADEIIRFGYIVPMDNRCHPGLVLAEDDLYTRLKPVLGTNFQGNLAYHTRKQVIITLHETAILGYQRQVIIDPRISNEVALFWEIYLDNRLFRQSADIAWQQLMAEIIITERTDEEADHKLAEDIKDILLKDAVTEDEEAQNKPN